MTFDYLATYLKKINLVLTSLYLLLLFIEQIELQELIAVDCY